MTICVLVVVFSIPSALNYNVDRVDFLHLTLQRNYYKMVYSGSCIFLIIIKDVTFDFLKDKISFENMIRCVIFYDMRV